ncbi:hypothetical protein [Mycoplasmopsis cynos]|uniref:hypothetical protein n=1 Tax=Mycoplasmopsis cynos TaxID=171284 RepID=UPI0021FCDCC8|nr:hypothetical protein [Mycoplasmopsis cynos]UWV77073.1 hypothetical protein NW070_04790 [Mycoplasmopsis cynos]
MICEQSLINMLKIDKEEAKNLANRICAMNDVISNKGAEFGLSEAYHIGHAYFKELNSSTLQEIFNNDIALIIKEYTRGRNSEEVDELIHKCLKLWMYHMKNKITFYGRDFSDIYKDIESTKTNYLIPNY